MLITSILILLIVLLLLFILCIGLPDWAAKARLRARYTPVKRVVRVIAAAEETITLPRTAGTTTAGLARLHWEQENALIGDLISTDRQTVTRRIIQATALPPAGTLARWNKFVYEGNPQSALGLDYQEITIPGPLGPLPAWFLAGERPTWIVIVHGFHATRQEALRVLPALAALHFPTLVITYRNDPGVPLSPDNRYHLGETEWQDVEAGVRHALEQGAQDVILFGWSMGGCLVETFLHRSSYAAQVRALILDSPILNWQRVLEAQMQTMHLPQMIAPLLRWRMERQASIDFAALNYEQPVKERSMPILLFHGTADAQVPVHSSDLFAQARPRHVTYLRVEEADHTLVWNSNPRAYEDALTTFLNHVSTSE